MKAHKKHLKILVASAVAVGLVFILCLSGPRHAKIQGKTPKQWARLVIARPTEIKNAPSSLRPALVPYLIDEIQRDWHPFSRDIGYNISSWLFDWAPEPLLAWVPEPISASDRQLHAVILLGELGPLAHQSVPLLIPLLDHDTLQCSVLFALQAIGPAARSAVPKMLQLLSEKPDLRIATALAHLAPEDPVVIRTLAEVSRTGSGDVRREAVAALTMCGTKLALSLALLESETAVSCSLVNREFWRPSIKLP